MKKVRKLFISDADEENYQEFLDRCLSGTLNDESISVDEKAQVVVNIADEGAEKVFEKPTDRFVHLCKCELFATPFCLKLES